MAYGTQWRSCEIVGPAIVAQAKCLLKVEDNRQRNAFAVDVQYMCSTASLSITWCEAFPFSGAGEDQPSLPQ